MMSSLKDGSDSTASFSIKEFSMKMGLKPHRDCRPVHQASRRCPEDINL